jgi:uncharacterized membrane protein YjfL (UPF0719 family)
MSGDEVLVLVVCLLVTLIEWGRWYWRVLRRRPVGARPPRVLLIVTPPATGLILLGVLATLASHDVRDSPVYLTFYFIMGAAWTILSLRMVGLMGIHTQRDAIHQRNGAAAVAVCGAIVGIGLAFAGGNVGDGPGWWVVVFAAALSTGGLFVAWGLVELLTHDADAITIDRDTASALRLAGLLVALGLIFGRAAAGNWVSAAATVRDFVAVGWPGILIALPAAMLDRMFAPAPTRPRPGRIIYGIIPALTYVFAAVVYVAGVSL